jgi:hypothetical protein
VGVEWGGVVGCGCGWCDVCESGVCVCACGGFVVGVWVGWGWVGWWDVVGVGCGGVGGVGVGGLPLRSNIPRSALCATLDTYSFVCKLFRSWSVVNFLDSRDNLVLCTYLKAACVFKKFVIQNISRTEES